MGNTWLRSAALAATLLVVPSAIWAQRDDEEWLRHCRDRADRDRLERFCEVRVERTRMSGTIRVEPGRNGGVAIEAWDRDEVEIHARIDARADTEREARSIAERVRIHHDGVIRVEGPRNERDASWHVSFVVFVPARSDLALSTRNGPLSVRGVSGRMDLEAHNGPLSLRDVAGDVRARTQNGPLDIRLTGSRWDGRGLDAEAHNGPINLSVPDGYNAQLETGTVNGPFTSDIPLTVTLRGRLTRPINATLGAGGAPIRAVTTNGPVRIRTH